MNGSADSIVYVTPNAEHEGLVVGLDAGMICEMWVSAGDFQVYLVGYFEDESHFYVNKTRYIPAVNDAYSTLDITASLVGGDATAVAVILQVGDATYWTARMTGSLDDFYRSKVHAHVIVGLNANRFDAKITNVVTGDFWLTGYIRRGVVMLSTAVEYAPAVGGAPVDLNALPAGATGAFFQVYNTNAVWKDYLIRPKGGADVLYTNCSWNEGFFVKCDANRLLEGRIEHANVHFALLGYSEDIPAVFLDTPKIEELPWSPAYLAEDYGQSAFIAASYWRLHSREVVLGARHIWQQVARR